MLLSVAVVQMLLTGTTNKYAITMTNPSFLAGSHLTDRMLILVLSFLATETNLATDNKNNLRCTIL